jgi:ribosomal protein L11 methyltransferase
VRAGREALRRAFPALAALQPVAWEPDGLLCAPRAAPELAGPALARCPLPVAALSAAPGHPDPPAEWVAGWYRRSPAHAPAPAGVPELVQAPGEGFGPGGHPTTAMCLGALPALPAGPALDVGTGSGLLAQAWAALGRGPVLALELDPRALAQAERSLEAAGLRGRVELRRGPAAALRAGELTGRVVLANVPLAAHRDLLAAVRAAPAAVLLSGLRPGQAGPLLPAYRRLGLRLLRAARRRGWEAYALVGGP